MACASGVAFQAAEPSWAAALEFALLDPVCLRARTCASSTDSRGRSPNRLYWTFLDSGEIRSCFVLCLSPKCPDFQKWAAWDRHQPERLLARQARARRRVERAAAPPSGVQEIGTAPRAPETSAKLPEQVAKVPRPELSQVFNRLFDLLQAYPSGLPDELIAALLWPDMSSERALHNLQAATYRLRNELGSKAIRFHSRLYGTRSPRNSFARGRGSWPSLATHAPKTLSRSV
jgi:hypothetical protein